MYYYMHLRGCHILPFQPVPMRSAERFEDYTTDACWPPPGLPISEVPLHYVFLTRDQDLVGVEGCCGAAGTRIRG